MSKDNNEMLNFYDIYVLVGVCSRNEFQEVFEDVLRDLKKILKNEGVKKEAIRLANDLFEKHTGDPNRLKRLIRELT